MKSLPSWFWLVTCHLSLVTLLISSAQAATREEEVVVHGDHVEYHELERRIIGTGHISATYQEVTLTCDRAVIYVATKDAFLSGHVRVVQPGGLLTGEEILYNFETRKGSVIHATGVVEPWRASGDRIDKVADSGFVGRRGFLASCDFESPHTRIQARQVRVVPGDRVIIRNALLYLGPVPVLYLPSYVHRLDDRRPRVTLTPGYSKEWGAFLLSAWRYYLHENLQGRIHLDYRERRSWGEGIDARYRLGSEENAGVFRYYYAHQRGINKGHRYKRKKKSPADVRERYRIQWRHRWEMDRDTTAVAELHRSKDEEFLQDFFEREFEQDVNPKTYLQVIRSTPWYGVSLLGRKRVNRYEAEVERLPEIQYDVRPTSIPLKRPWQIFIPWTRDEEDLFDLGQWRRGWYYQSTTTYSALYDKAVYDGVNDHVRRLDTSHQVSYQARLLGGVNVTPFVSVRQTAYSKMGLRDEGVIRGAMETGMDVSTKFFRIFDITTDTAGLDLHRLRHVITPNLSYRYRPPPTIPSAQLMQFDGVDSLDRTNVLTPSLEQKLQTKHRVGTRLQSIDLARFVVSTDYTFRGKNDTGGQLSNITGDLELKPYPWLLFETDTTFATHRRQFQAVNVDLVAGPGAGYETTDVGTVRGFDRRATSETELPWAVGAGWRWRRDDHAQITFETIFDVGPKWRIGLYERADVRRVNSDGSKFINRPAESEIRIRRDLHEWTVELVLNRHRAEGNFFLLLFRMKAFPEQPIEFERNYNRPKLGNRRPIFSG